MAERESDVVIVGAHSPEHGVCRETPHIGGKVSTPLWRRWCLVAKRDVIAVGRSAAEALAARAPGEAEALA